MRDKAKKEMKEKIRQLEIYLDMKQSQINTLFAMVKTLVAQCGEQNGNEYRFSVPYFEPEEINKQYSISTEIEADDEAVRFFSMVVTKHEEEKKENAPGET